MYQLIRATRRADLVRQQGPVLAVSLLIAELFYKFHSFTLETVAFLATWFVLDWLAQTLLRFIRKPALDAK